MCDCLGVCVTVSKVASIRAAELDWILWESAANSRKRSRNAWIVETLNEAAARDLAERERVKEEVAERERLKQLLGGRY